MKTKNPENQIDIKTKLFPTVYRISILLFALTMFTMGMPGIAWMYIVVKPLESLGINLRGLESDGIWAGIIFIGLLGPILMSLAAWILDKYSKNDGNRPWLAWLLLTYVLHFFATYLILQ